MYKSGKTFRYLFIITAVIIAIASVWVTNSLVKELKEEERKKIENWAEAVKTLQTMAMQTLPDNIDPNIFNEYDKMLVNIIQENTTIPLIHIDNEGTVLAEINIKIPERHHEQYIQDKIKDLSKKHEPIVYMLDEDTYYVYYDDSTVLKQLQLFPYIQLTVVFIFVIISFFALNSTQRAEQNKVWVGLSKETAHQLGTPISSLMAWVEYLKSKEIDPTLLTEMDKDVHRLKTIAERFSKIGSKPAPEPMDLNESIHNAIEYMGKRISSKVNISTQFPENKLCVLMNESLFGWVVENLIKNAVDAMDGQGEITITAHEKGKKVIMDISDSGKGIPKSKFDTVFHPGYTTKKRGWGLGLSLVKRIIESYHKGKIYVYKSELGKGTTFRIELNQHYS